MVNILKGSRYLLGILGALLFVFGSAGYSLAQEKSEDTDEFTLEEILAGGRMDKHLVLRGEHDVAKGIAARGE